MKDREDYFTGAQRSQIVWQILLRTPYDVTRPDKVRPLLDIIFLSSSHVLLFGPVCPKLRERGTAEQSKTSVIHLQVGVVRLINKNVVEACFPLHEGRHDINGPQGEKSDRRVS